MEEKLYIAMVGLPARGKSTTALKLQENLSNEGIRSRIFNNGDVRRRMLRENTSHAGFYSPRNTEAATTREVIAIISINEARDYLAGNGQIAILDATNVTVARRDKIRDLCGDHPLLFVECVNNDMELVAASVAQKIKLPEFSHLRPSEAMSSFGDRIAYYQSIYKTLREDENGLTIDSVNNRILREHVDLSVPYYAKIRDLLVSDWVKNLYLVRHGQTYYNLEERVGGDPSLTEKGLAQAHALAKHFERLDLPYIFISTRMRSMQMASPLAGDRPDRTIIPLEEFNEIRSGVCEDMTYAEIREQYPEEFAARARDKYNYVYPEGEGYVTLRERVNRGIKKALYLSGNAENIMIVGHQAVNRMILAHFLFRRTEDVPYTYIPQDQYFHIVSTQMKKVFETVPFEGCVHPGS